MDSVSVEALQRQIDDLRTALHQKDQALAATFNLTSTTSDLLGLLLVCEYVSVEIIKTIITPAHRIAVYRLRKSMKPFDITIQSKTTLGYWLEQKDKDAINGYLASGHLPQKGNRRTGEDIPELTQ